MSPSRIPEKRVTLQDFSIKNLRIFVQGEEVTLEECVRFFG